MANSALYYGDNLEIMRALLKERGAFIDLIYIDPPFNSKRNYNILFKDRQKDDETAQIEAFKDTWSNVRYQDNIEEIKSLGLRDVNDYLAFIKYPRLPLGYISYLSMMAIRIHYMRALLKDSGGFYLHCDPTMSHYLKIVCDLIFGEGNFVNEIVWRYQTGGAGKRRFSKKHDVILFYGKTDKYKFDYMATKIARAEKALKRAANPKGARIGADDTVKIATDVFDIAALNPMSNERLGYPTQKPLALLERIIKASSAKGDVVADFFCGCGTTIDAAIRLKRNYVGADILPISVALTQKRIKDAHGHAPNSHYSLRGLPREFDWRQELSPSRQKLILDRRTRNGGRFARKKSTIGARAAL